MYSNFLKKFLDNSKSNFFNQNVQKFWEEDHMEWKFLIKNFWEFEQTFRSRPHSQKFQKISFRLPLEISRNAKENFWSNGKHSYFQAQPGAFNPQITSTFTTLSSLNWFLPLHPLCSFAVSFRSAPTTKQIGTWSNHGHSLQTWPQKGMEMWW